jgi:nicotinic acid mononucleotide adenylyltransferase
MCELAVSTQEQRARFIMVDTWEALQSAYQPTANVLDRETLLPCTWRTWEN